MIKINPSDLIPMDLFVGTEPISIDLVYQDADHPRNIFNIALYHNSTRLWLHKRTAAIVILAARIMLWHGTQHKKQIWHLQLKDGLRPIEAQASMLNTDIVKQNPQWTVLGPHLMVSPAGIGAHPRGMAIDMIPVDPQGNAIPMGTEFDEMTTQAARSCTDIPPHPLENRHLFDKCVQEAAILLDESDFHGLSSEWWDFRFGKETYGQYEAISDHDLPPQMQMTTIIDNGIKDFPNSHFESLAEQLLTLVNQHNDYL